MASDESNAAANEGAAAGPAYKVICTQEFVRAANPRRRERQRIEILSGVDRAKEMAGIFGSIPPARPGAKPAYHFHRRRESLIQILAGAATELVEGEAVPLAVGDIIVLRPDVRHTLVNNSATEELQYIEFYAPKGFGCRSRWRRRLRQRRAGRRRRPWRSKHPAIKP